MLHTDKVGERLIHLMKYAVLTALLIIDLSIYAQDCVVKVEQAFRTKNKCSGGHPSIQRMMVSLNGSDYGSSKGVGFESGDIAECADNANPHETFWDYSLVAARRPTKVSVYNEIVGFGRKRRVWKQDHVYSNLSVGENVLDDLRATVKCSMFNTESYVLSTKITIDCPIPLDFQSRMAKVKSSHLVIEKDEKLLLMVGEFYNAPGHNPKLQVSINGVGKDDLTGRSYEVDGDEFWINLGCNVSPKRSITLSYEDIVGKPSDSNPLYQKASGRAMSFRVKKKMVDGVRRCGNVLTNVKFYHQGPSFELVQSRRVDCIGGSGLSLTIKLANPKEVGKYKGDFMQWVLTHGLTDVKGPSRIFRLSQNDVLQDGGLMSLSERDEEEGGLADYLNEKSDDGVKPTEGEWRLQLQYKDKSLNEGLSFVSKTVKMPPLTSFGVGQGYTDYKTLDDFEVVSTCAPEVIVKFDDDDWQNRMGYDIFQFGDGESSIWSGVRGDREKAAAFGAMRQGVNPVHRIASAQHNGSGVYYVPKLKVGKEAKGRYFYVQDRDKCIYEVKYKALQREFSTTPKSGEAFDLHKDSGDAPSSARYSTTIKYDGGAFPYGYKGTERRPNDEISVDGLGFQIDNGEVASGRNVIAFKGCDGKEETVTIDIPFAPPSFNVVAQTCTEPNGKVLLSSYGTFAPVKYTIGDVESQNGRFDGLEAGEHKVRCHYSDGCSTTVNVNVPKRIFSIDRVEDILLQDFDCTAIVAIEPRNYAALSWANGGCYNISDLGSHTLASGTYKYRVTNLSDISNDQCVIEGGFAITAPHAEIGLRVETFAEKGGRILTDITKSRIENSEAIGSSIRYYSVFDGEDVSVGEQRDYSGGRLSFVAKYTVGGEEKTYEIGQGDGVTPILLKGGNETFWEEDGMPQPKCNGESVTWTLADGYEACIKGSDAWGKSVTLRQGANAVTIRKRETLKLGNSVDFIATVENIGYRDLTIDIDEIPPISVGFAETPVTCLGDKDGAVEITSVLPQYEWSKYSYEITKDGCSSNTTKLENLSSGKGVILVTDNFCNYSSRPIEFAIESPVASLGVDTKIVQPSCHDNGAVLSVKVNGGWGRYKLFLDGVETFDEVAENELKTFEQLKEGKRVIRVEDGGGCAQTAAVTVEPYLSPSVTHATSVSASCYGRNDGGVNGIVVETNGTLNGKVVSVAKLLYSFTPKDDTLYGKIDRKEMAWADRVVGLAAGEYSLWVEDSEGCMTETGKRYAVSVSEPAPLRVSAIALDNGRIKRKGGDDGRAEIKVNGGNVGNAHISYYGGNQTVVPTNVPYVVGGLSAGQVGISATDERGCQSDTARISFEEPGRALSVETKTTAALCHAMTGAVCVKASGGWGGYSIRLVGEREKRNVSSDAEVHFAELYAGDYSVIVTDKGGAECTQSVRVESPGPVCHTFTTTADVCGGNGSVAIQLGGGTPAYASLFNQETDTIRGDEVVRGGLIGGREYTLTTFDANRCVSRVTFAMPDEHLEADIKHTYCADGVRLTAEVSGGAKPYTYRWRNVSGSADLGVSAQTTVAQSGFYRLDVTDASGCSRATTKAILTAGSLAMRVRSLKRATNVENDNGSAEIACRATHPAKIRVYHLETDTWTASLSMPNDTSITLSGLRPGHYGVEGTLEDGNRQMAQFHIAPYEPMEVTNIGVRNVSAAGRSDARVVVDFEGGIAPYILNDTATFETAHMELAGLKAGLFALSIADSVGNVLAKDVEILEPGPLAVRKKEVVNASCNTYDDGSVTLTAHGGWGDYQFASGEGDYRNSAYFGELGAGERTFKVVDKYGVVDSVRVAISEPQPLRASVAAIDSASCKGMNDGTARFNVTGGTAPYRTAYEKETLDGTDVTLLASGHYVMTFTDSRKCQALDTVSVYIPEPELLELAKDEVVHTTCELDNGKIAIEVKGGSLPYKYEWTENGKGYDGAKTVGAVGSEAEGLKQNGLYHIGITDLHGCVAEYDRRIELSANPRVLSVETADVLCHGSSDGVATVDSSQVMWGFPKADYRLTWPQGQTDVMSVNTLPAGTYAVRITDDNNCSTTTEFTVGTPMTVESRLIGIRNALCYGYSDGRIETNAIGGVGEYTYVWNTGETTSFADGLKAGTYTVVVADGHGCPDTATYEVEEPEELRVSLGDDVVACPGNVHVFDGGEYAAYSWCNAATGEEIETGRYLATGEEGDFALKVTDVTGCMARDTVNMSIGENALIADFLMASDAAVGDTIMIVELSSIPVDSVRWEYDTASLSTVDLADAESYMFHLSAWRTGRYYITMWAYSGGCEAFEQKSIDIYEAVEETGDFKIGYDPLIKQVKVSPNPNDGEFDLLVKLREVSDVGVTVHDANNGRRVESVALKGSDRYNVRLNIKRWGSGVFVLSVVSGGERRAVKVLSVR